MSPPASLDILRTGYKIHVSPSALASRHSCEIISRAVAASRGRFEMALQRSRDRGLTTKYSRASSIMVSPAA
jgi:hypothetical protein